MNKLLVELKNMDTSIISLMKNGIKFSFYINIISNIFLLMYDFYFCSPSIYYIGISLFKTSLFFIVSFIICGFAFSKIKKELGI